MESNGAKKKFRIPVPVLVKDEVQTVLSFSVASCLDDLEQDEIAKAVGASVAFAMTEDDEEMEFLEMLGRNGRSMLGVCFQIGASYLALKYLEKQEKQQAKEGV